MLTKKYIRIVSSGYGHWKVTINYYNKNRTFITSNSHAIDDYRSEEPHKINKGYNALMKACRISISL